MSRISVLLEVGAPSLALVCLLAIVWARQQDNQIRRKIRQLQGRIEADLDSFQTKSHRVRQRIIMIAEVYCRGNPAKMAELTKGLDDLILRMHEVNGHIEAVVDQLPRSRRRELRSHQLRLVELSRAVVELASDLDESDRIWARELAGLGGLKVEPSQAVGARAMNGWT